LSCTNINTGFNLVRNYYQWFQNYSYTQPEFWPEFEAGWFQPWAGNFYDDCLAGMFNPWCGKFSADVNMLTAFSLHRT